MDDALIADRHNARQAILPPCRCVVCCQAAAVLLQLIEHAVDGVQGAHTVCLCWLRGVEAGLVLSGQWLWLIAVFPTQQQNETACEAGAVRRALLRRESDCWQLLIFLKLRYLFQVDERVLKG